MKNEKGGLTAREKEALRLFIEKVRRKLPGTDFILFGSKARGEGRADSDIDLLILLDGEVDNRLRGEIYDWAYDYELDNDVVMEFSVHSKRLWAELKDVLPFAVNIGREGIRL